MKEKSYKNKAIDAKKALEELAEIKFKSEGALQFVPITWLFEKQFSVIEELIDEILTYEKNR